jgi:hypothetical protein
MKQQKKSFSSRLVRQEVGITQTSLNVDERVAFSGPSLALPIWILLFSLGSVVGVGPADGIVLSTATTLNICAGVWVARFLLSPNPKSESVWSSPAIGLGISFGTVIPALVAVVNQPLGVQFINPHLVFPIVFVLFNLRELRMKISAIKPLRTMRSKGTSRQIYDEMLVVFAGSLLVLFGWSWRILYLLVFLGMILLGGWKLNKKASLGTLLLVTVGSALIAEIVVRITERPIAADWIGLDVLWDEAQGVASARELFSDALYFGHTHHIYFLANLWSGSLAHLADSDPLVVSGMFGIAVGVLQLVWVACNSAKLLFGTLSAGVAAVILLAAQAAFPDDVIVTEALRVPNLLPLGWLLSAVLLLLLVPESNQLRIYVASGVFLLAVALAKLPYMFVAIVVVSALLLVRRGWSRSKERQRILFLFTILFLVVVGVVVLFQWMGENSGSTTSNFSLAASISLLGVLLFRGLGFQISRSQKPTGLLRLALFGGVLVGSLLFSNHGFHLVVSAALAVGAVLVSDEVATQFRRFSRVGFLAVVAVLGALVAATYWTVHLHSVRTEGVVNSVLFGREELWWYGLIAALILIGHVTFRAWVERAVIVVALGVGLYFGHAFQQPIEASVYRLGEGYSILTDTDRLQVASWIRKNTHSDAVIASNSVCQDAVEVGEPTPSATGTCQSRNQDAWVAALTGRRTYFEAPLWSSAGLELNATEVSQYLTVNSFVSPFSQETARRLQNEGVGFFLIDKENSPERSLICAAVVFDSGRYAVVDLRVSLRHACQ